jgi:pyrroline-5-carboxylate reductase
VNEQAPSRNSSLRVAVIGAGAMGGAIIAGLLRNNIVPPDQIMAADPSEERRHNLLERYYIGVTDHNAEAASWGQVVIFAVKPQQVPAVLPPLRSALSDESLCLSVIAGMPIATFVETLQHPAVVRSIPNTPAQIGEGMTVWTTAPDVNEQQRTWAATVLGALGRERFVENESYLDMATALNGSGPAYVFLILEAMIDAGVRLGLARPLAAELAQQTMLGAVRYSQQSEQHLAELRNAVTSPGGTTAAGLSELERGGLRATIDAAIGAAYRRSQELGSAKQRPAPDDQSNTGK